MTSRNLSRRLERLEAGLGLSRGQRFIECGVIRAETGEVVQRILMPFGEDRRRGTRSWQQKTYEYSQQTTAQT